MEQGKICCFTGHRRIRDEHIVKIPEQLNIQLEKLLAEGVCHFRVGGAIGFDTICALKVLDKKRSFPNITLELCLPCKNQTDAWSEHDKFVYNYVLQLADKISYAEDYYTKGCMHKRNRMLVDGADVCIAYCSKSTGGTAYTCSYAKQKQVKLINIYDILK